MEDMEAQTLEAKLQTLRAHREWKCNVKWEALNEHGATWRKNGLADLDYEVRTKGRRVACVCLLAYGHIVWSSLTLLGWYHPHAQVLATEALGPHATKYTVDVKLNGHWTDTVHEAPPSANDGHRGGHGGRGWRGGGRGGGGGGGGGGGWGRGNRNHEPDPKRRRHG